MAEYETRIFAFFLLAALLPAAALGTCGTLSSTPDSQGYASVCANILAYTDVYILTPSVACTAADDNAISLVMMYAASLSSPCADAVLRYTCGYFHRPCAAPLGPPQSVCDKLNSTNVANVCNQLDHGVLQVIQAAIQANGASSFDYAGCSTPSFTAYKTPANTTSPTFSDSEMGLPGCVDYPGGTICDGVVNYKVYATQRALSSVQLAQAAQLVNGFSFLNNLVPKTCLNNYHKLLCYTAFPRCHNLLTDLPQTTPLAQAGLTVPFPRMPSSSLCGDVLSGCGNDPYGSPWVASWFQPLGLTPNFCSSTGAMTRTCNGNVSATASPLPRFYPTTGLPIVTGGANVLPNDVNNSLIVPSYFNCPAPLVAPDDPNAPTLLGGSCATPCPLFMFPDQHWHNLDMIFYICGSVSFFFSSLLVIKFVCYHGQRKRKWPLTLLVCATWSIGTALYIPVISSDNGQGRGSTISVLCKDNSQLNDSTGIKAAFAFIYLTAMFISWCSLSMNVDLFQSIFGPTHQRLVRFIEGAMRIFTLVFILFVASVLLYGVITDKFGPGAFDDPSVPWNSDDHPDPNTNFQLVPLLTLVWSGILCLAAVVVQVWLTTQATRSRSVSRRSSFSRGFALHGRTIGVILVLVTETSVLGIYFLSERVKAHQYTADAVAYVQCLLVDRPTSTLLASVDPTVPVADCVIASRSALLSEVIYAIVQLFGFLLSLVYLVPCQATDWKRLGGKLFPCVLEDRPSETSKFHGSPTLGGDEADTMTINYSIKSRAGLDLDLPSRTSRNSSRSPRPSPRTPGVPKGAIRSAFDVAAFPSCSPPVSVMSSTPRPTGPLLSTVASEALRDSPSLPDQPHETEFTIVVVPVSLPGTIDSQPEALALQ